LAASESVASAAYSRYANKLIELLQQA
jgi:hypothetical protein